jgi:ubiquinone/menaquinone biosynthesis C-methylase UbiE
MGTTSSTKDAVKRRFSEVASDWADSYAHPDGDALHVKNLMTRLRFVVQAVEGHLPRGAKILDVGCGPGGMAAKLIELGYEVWGVDIAENMIRHAQERCGAERFRVGDIEQIPFPDNTFDGVVCLGVIEYLDADASALGEIERVLKPDGTAVITTPSATCPLYRMDRIGVVAQPLYDFLRYRLRGKPVPARPPQGFGRKYHRDSWFRLLRSAGLEPNEWLCYGWGWHVSSVGIVIGILSRLTERAGNAIGRLLGRARAHRIGDRLARSRVFNWMAFEQLVRVRAVKYNGAAHGKGH